MEGNQAASDIVSTLPLRVALLCGGESAEREISLRSGRQVHDALRQSGHAVEVIDPAATFLPNVDWRRFDVCFLALHGGAGEDGRVQQWLSRRGVAYVGSGPAASKAAMSKSAAKALFARRGVPTPEWAEVDPHDTPLDVLGRIVTFGLPVVVKPDGQGSSLGVSVVRDRDELAACIAAARRLDRRVLIERFVRGREMTVAVLGRRPLPVLEVLGGGEVFDYQSKYNSTVVEYRFSTDLGPMKLEEVQQTAVAAADALGTAGLVRVDVIVDRQGRPCVLEVNTLPGMTDRSMAPRAAAAAGMSLPALCDWMLRDALTRRAA